MNIKEAKEQIKNAVTVYLKKDEYGEYKIPVVRQRPVFLIGAPGIGKTAIMEQIASELSIALVSYSMTHHTRQSALGLPFISHKTYGDEEFDVSEYTMSEIISSIYEVMEKSGIKEGILFLDEINCVSETLAPSMLQFLQYKVFGRHKIPDGWVIVTAGNPPEFNKSVREFDVVTMDRLKILNVEADYGIWKSYAKERHIHNAIISYLDLKKDDFYRIESTVDGKNYVTARGWEDLSETMLLYEEEGLVVDEVLIGQYLNHDRVTKEFAAFYDIYQKYKRDYKVNEILAGKATAQIKERARMAKFDERVALVSMLIEKIQQNIQEHMELSDSLTELMKPLKALKVNPVKTALELADRFSSFEKGMISKMESLKLAGSLSDVEKRKLRFLENFYKEAAKAIRFSDAASFEDAFAVVKKMFDEQVLSMKEDNGKIKAKMHEMFAFVEDVFEDGNEMLLVVTELTVNSYTARFISLFGSDDYTKYNQKMMITERKDTILSKLEEMEL